MQFYDLRVCRDRMGAEDLTSIANLAHANMGCLSGNALKGVTIWGWPRALYRAQFSRTPVVYPDIIEYHHIGVYLDIRPPISKYSRI